MDFRSAKNDRSLNVATEAQAREITKEITDLLDKHGIWYNMTEKMAPNLRFITFTDISIKVNQEVPK